MHKSSAVAKAVLCPSRCPQPRRALSTCPASIASRSKIPSAPFPRRVRPRTIRNACPFSTYPKRLASTSSPDAGKLERTALYDLHVAHGAKMVPFAGYSMPVQYADQGIIQSHRWTREKASLFDVGHMVQHRITGPMACQFLESITPTSLTSIGEKRSTLSCLLNESGGIVDDCVIARLPSGEWYMVTNAACRETDLKFLNDHATQFRQQHGADAVTMEVIPNGLIALQGPLSAEVLQEHAQILNSDSSPHDPAATDLKIDLQTFYFGMCLPLTIKLPDIDPFPGLVSRGGYTGEDGFELSLPAEHTERVTKLLLDAAGPDTLRLAGLGARDSLRLEAGMCLYGHDLDATTTPVEAGLGWIVSPPRRKAADFPGAPIILDQLSKIKSKTPLARRRVGLVVEGPPAREGAVIGVSEAQSGGGIVEVGKVTSGCPSPTLGKNVAMGYVHGRCFKSGTELVVVVRGRQCKATVVKMPFVESKYWKQAAGTAPG